MHSHPMRQDQRRISDRTQLTAILRSCDYGHLALCDGAAPYVIALHYRWIEEQGQDLFYFHSAPLGRKIDCIRRNPRACFMVETDVRFVRPPQLDSCQWTSHFKSVIAEGNISIISEPAEQQAALAIFMQRFVPELPIFPCPPGIFDKMLMLKMQVTEIQGKQLP
jgi:nitroimidazol reductase NimA-like FMN-containing flavoprotein (pyridoxamine 5'-phosphate oxidase superfamily)